MFASWWHTSHQALEGRWPVPVPAAEQYGGGGGVDPRLTSVFIPASSCLRSSLEKQPEGGGRRGGQRVLGESLCLSAGDYVTQKTKTGLQRRNGKKQNKTKAVSIHSGCLLCLESSEHSCPPQAWSELCRLGSVSPEKVSGNHWFLFNAWLEGWEEVSPLPSSAKGLHSLWAKYFFILEVVGIFPW